MSETISRRDFVSLLGLGAAFTLAPSGWAATVSADEAAKGLLIRPYLQPGPRAGAGLDCKDILWMTDNRGGTFTVEYGWPGTEPSAPVQRAEIKLAAPTDAQLKTKHPTTQTTGEAHEIVKAWGLETQTQHYVKFWATLDNLPRDVEAWYRVKRGDEVLSENHFRTRASADQPISFVAVGDLTNGKAGQAAVAYQASLVNPQFFLALGDLCYPLGRLSQYRDHFWGTYANVEKPAVTVGAPLMETTPFYALLGNHDVDTSLNIFPDCLGIYYFFHAPDNGPGEGHWGTPLGRDKDEVAQFRAATTRSFPALGFYSFDEGPAHFVVVDSNGYCPIDHPALVAWLERDLNASNAPWKFVCMHAPMFHSSPQHFVEQKMRLLGSVLSQCKVDVVLSAHVHNYQRSRPMDFAPAPRKPGDRLVHGTFTIDNKFDGISRTRPSGTIHIVSGGGGGSLVKDDLKKVEAKAERHIYVADHSVKKVFKMKEDGTILWEADNNNGHDVQLLKNGDVLVNCPPTVREYSPDGKIVWELPKGVVGGAESAQRLDNGHTVIADNGKHRVVEIDADNKIVWSFDVPNSNDRKSPTMRQVRRLDNGNTLICASTLDKVMEVSPEGKVVWEYSLPFPYLATRLPDGHTLISSGDGYGSATGFFVIEVDHDGKTIWKYGGTEAPKDEKLNWPSGFVRLPNGNTLISEAHAGQIREVSPDKKTVRIIKSPAMKHPCTLVVVDE